MPLPMIGLWGLRLTIASSTDRTRDAFMHTGGKMGERQSDELMTEVAVATTATDLDQRRLGMQSWCDTQKTRLAGFVRAKN